MAVAKELLSIQYANTLLHIQPISMLLQVLHCLWY